MHKNKIKNPTKNIAAIIISIIDHMGRPLIY